MSDVGNQAWTQNVAGVEDLGDVADRLGASVDVADFNGDGAADIAAGVPGEALAAAAGAVAVLYGGAGGVSATDDQLFSQDSGGVEDSEEPGDRFGASVTAGDFDADGFADLAVGAPGESVDADLAAGAVNVLYGTATGLSDADDELWHQSIGTIVNAAEAGDEFGLSLAAGDFDGNGADDLAAGVPAEDLAGAPDGGAVNVIYGAALGGLSDVGDQLWHQDTAGIEGGAEPDDVFGDPSAPSRRRRAGQRRPGGHHRRDRTGLRRERGADRDRPGRDRHRRRLAQLAGAQVRIGAGFSAAQDELDFTPVAGITGNYVDATGTLTFTGVAPAADYQHALQSVTYENESDDPTTGRTINFSATDSDGATNGNTRNIAITPSDDASDAVADSESVDEDSGATTFDVRGNDTDVDSTVESRSPSAASSTAPAA